MAPLLDALQAKGGYKACGVISVIMSHPMTEGELMVYFKDAPKTLKMSSFKNQPKISGLLYSLLSNGGLVERIDTDKINKKRRYYTGRWSFNFAALFPPAVLSELEQKGIKKEDAAKAVQCIFLRDASLIDVIIDFRVLISNISSGLKNVAPFFHELCALQDIQDQLDFQKAVQTKFEKEKKASAYLKVHVKKFEKNTSLLIEKKALSAEHVLSQNKLPRHLLSLLKTLKQGENSQYIVLDGKRLPFNYHLLLQVIFDICEELDSQLGYKPFPVETLYLE